MLVPSCDPETAEIAVFCGDLPNRFPNLYIYGAYNRVQTPPTVDRDEEEADEEDDMDEEDEDEEPEKDYTIYVTNFNSTAFIDDIISKSEIPITLKTEGVGVWESCRHQSVGFSMDLRKDYLNVCKQIARVIYSH